MTLPETIPVKYTEEEAEYLSVRPVVAQTFRLDELLDMLVRVTGKDVARLQKVLRAGTTVYRSYRYWWPGFDAGAEELEGALAGFPEADPSRPFERGTCTTVRWEHTSAPGRVLGEIGREEASARRWFRRGSFWDELMRLAERRGPTYDTYSYAQAGDVYHLEMTPALAGEILDAARRMARRRVGARLGGLAQANRIVLVCARGSLARDARGC